MRKGVCAMGFYKYKQIDKDVLFALSCFAENHDWSTGGFSVMLAETKLGRFRDFDLMYFHEIYVCKKRNKFYVANEKYFCAMDFMINITADTLLKLKRKLKNKRGVK